jgi:hypothetical protein
MRPLLEDEAKKNNRKAFTKLLKRCGESLPKALDTILDIMDDPNAPITSKLQAARTVIDLVSSGDKVLKSYLEDRLENEYGKAKQTKKKIIEENPELDEETEVVVSITGT